MTEVKLGLLENLALNNWYKFLLYMGGVMLIISMFLEPKGITTSQLRSFSIYTIILSLIVWIVYDRLNGYANYMDKYEYERSRSGIIFVNYLIAFVALCIWIFSIVPIIPYA